MLQKYLRRWWEFNARFFGAIHRAADVVAGLSFLFVVSFGFLLSQPRLGIEIYSSQGALRVFYYGFVISLGLFTVAVIVQTAAGLRSFVAKLKIRLFE